MKTETLKSFKDVPDPISQIHLQKSLNHSIQIKWDQPEDNNLSIVQYNIYLSDKIIHNIGSIDLFIEQENRVS